MRNFLLKIFLLITLRLCSTMGYPNWSNYLDKQNPYTDVSVARTISSFTEWPAETYVCLYISSTMEPCYNEEKKNFESTSTSSPILQQISNGKIYLSHSSLCIPGLEKSQKQTFREIFTVTLVGCRPHKVPFTLPCCVMDDLVDERRTKGKFKQSRNPRSTSMSKL